MAMPVLFTRIEKEAALAAFHDGWRKPKGYCGERFLVTGKTILFFAPLSECEVVSPTSLTWRPSELEFLPGEKPGWFPKAVRPEYDQGKKAWRTETHLFIEQAPDWLYCGPVHLTGYQYTESGRPSPSDHVSYHLTHKMPYDIWVDLGGYPDWLVSIAGVEHRLSEGQEADLDALIADLPEGHTHVELRRWREDSLSVHLNQDRAFPMYLNDPRDSGLYVQGKKDAEGYEPFSCQCCGIVGQAGFHGDGKIG